MAFGTFDGLHPGHRFFLEQARALGDALIVIVARDTNVKKIKGKTAMHDESARLKALTESGLVDKAELGNPTDFYQCLRDHKPEVVALGYDQKADESAIREVLPEVTIKRVDAFKPEQYKSSLLRA